MMVKQLATHEQACSCSTVCLLLPPASEATHPRICGHREDFSLYGGGVGRGWCEWGSEGVGDNQQNEISFGPISKLLSWLLLLFKLA